MGKLTWEIKIHNIEDLRKYSSKIIELYKSGKNFDQIAKELGCYGNRVKDILLENGVELRPLHPEISTEELESNYEDIKKKYLEENMSSQEIADFYKVKRHRINYLLEKHGIQKSFSEARREYKLDEHFFDEIDTPNKAYILGFFYADGYNNSINNSMYLSLKDTDEDILQDIKRYIGTDRPLFHFIGKRNDGSPDRKMVSLIMSSKHMCEMFAKYGCPTAKTFALKFPDFLREDLYSHFIRGYFDGDGCASIVKENDFKKKRARTRLNITMVSSAEFCYGLQNFLKNKCDINFNVNKISGHKEENRIIRSGSNQETKKFMDYIYRDADLYMKRKHNKFVEYFNKNN